jgi:hypothetical protein
VDCLSSSDFVVISINFIVCFPKDSLAILPEIKIEDTWICLPILEIKTGTNIILWSFSYTLTIDWKIITENLKYFEESYFILLHFSFCICNEFYFFVAKQCYFQFIYLNIFIDVHDFTLFYLFCIINVCLHAYV